MARLAFLLVPTLLVTAAEAHAQAVPPPDATIPAQRAPEAPVSAFEQVGLHGIEVEIGGMAQTGGSDSPVQAPTLWGAGGAAVSNLAPRGTLLDPGGAATLGQTFHPYGFDPLGFSARVGYRLRRYLSVGVFFSFAQYFIGDGAYTGDALDGTSALARQQASVGVYARYYVTQLHRRLHPWVSLGVGYNYDAASYSRGIAPATGLESGQLELGNYILQQHGIVVPVSVGLDVRLAPIFTLGPMLGYARVFPFRGCVEVDVDQYSPPQLPGQLTCSSPPVQNNGYDNFFGGVFAKVTLDPFAR
jgi:hypothetical protein